MSFPTSSAEVEVLVRGLIATKCAAVDGVSNVFDEPIYLPDKGEAAEQLGFTTADGIEIRYLSIQWAGWEDTDKGCDYAPVYNLLYTLRVGQEFVPLRSDGSNSEKDFSAQCLNLRDAFLVDKDLGLPLNLYCERLVLSEAVALGDDSHTGMFGHTVEFGLKVEVMPIG